ncbi:MAG: hypothetical protein H0V51_09725, partial [Chloroflexi bacterium]|nr:hypothetical protein [Chloroflexota bacterium]
MATDRVGARFIAPSGFAPDGGPQCPRVPQSLCGALVYRATLLAVALAGRVPPAVAYPILDRLGDLLWLLDRPARRAVEGNLRRVLGGRGPRWRWAVRGVFRHGARGYYDTFRLPRLSAAEILALVPVRGWEHLDGALARGAGAIIVTAHMSSVGLAAQSIAARGHPTTT